MGGRSSGSLLLLAAVLSPRSARLNVLRHQKSIRILHGCGVSYTPLHTGFLPPFPLALDFPAVICTLKTSQRLVAHPASDGLHWPGRDVATHRLCVSWRCTVNRIGGETRGGRLDIGKRDACCDGRRAGTPTTKKNMTQMPSKDHLCSNPSANIPAKFSGRSGCVL